MFTKYKIQKITEQPITVPVYPENSSSFENIVFVSYNGTDEGVIFRYTPDSEWFDNHYSPEGMVIYTGLIEVLSLSGELIISSYYHDGVRLETPNSRVSEMCETWIDVAWTIVTADGNSYITEFIWTEYEACQGGGGLPRPGTGSGNGEGPGSGGGGSGGGTPTPIGVLLPNKCPEGTLLAKKGCVCEFGEDENGICFSRECDNGFLVHPVTHECYCPNTMEVINGKCSPKCPRAGGLRRSADGGCEVIETCVTDDEIINILQTIFGDIWEGSNANHPSIPMAGRLEQGGWIVHNGGGYSYVPFPDSWEVMPCGIELPADWANNLPSNLTGYVHSHPFYQGENTKGVCGEGGDESYIGGPSDPDYVFLVALMNIVGYFGLKSYVIDGNSVHSVDFLQNIISNDRYSTPQCSDHLLGLLR